MFKDIEGVIFDMDGTLIDSMGVWAEIDREFLNKRRILVPGDIQKAIEGKSFTETAIYFKETFNLKESVEEIKEEWINMSIDYYKNVIPLKTGAKEFIQHLYSKGYKIGLATSSQRYLVDVILEKFGLKSFFSSIRTSCEVGKGKPFPDVFLKVAEDLQISPAKCLVFEDTFAGVLAAKRAQMKVIAVYDSHSLAYLEEIQRMADGYIKSFREIA